MEGVGRKVVLKLGGGLLTNKKGLCSPDIEAIQQSAKTIHELIFNGCKIALVHGAGSFGHARAKTWRLSEGKLDQKFPAEGEITTQEEAVKQVRLDMINLNQILINELDLLGVEYEVFHPHTWAKETGPNFQGDLEFLDSEIMSIVHGDVVEHSEKGFGILSGDDLMYRISTEWGDVDSCVFALADCDGIMSHPPGNPKSALIPEWNSKMGFGSKHDTEHDVTGGIQYKAIRASEISQKNGNRTEVWFVDGRRPERVFDACMGGNALGTKIL
tara:strand:+ start:6099 stop:6914 length:816 start_codon:yes stop_codon:yes gene_type:complete